VATNFTNRLTDNGFNPAFADYRAHNAATFDPYAILEIEHKPFGNDGIDSIRNAIHQILEEYNKNSISASEVDIVAHVWED
jgi:hypothetical protein